MPADIYVLDLYNVHQISARYHLDIYQASPIDNRLKLSDDRSARTIHLVL